jgi:hypothetical protein
LRFILPIAQGGALTTFAAPLDQQIDAYVAADYPSLAGITEAEFRALFNGLEVPADADGQFPAVAVVTEKVINPQKRVPALRLAGSVREGILDKNHGEEGLAPYKPVDGLDIPDAPVYLLLGVDRGDEFRDERPLDALATVKERGRTPLTIDEGLSLQTVFPGALEKNHCFMLMGSSRGDKRVPALWISEKAPKLGWCFDRNPHSWLGIASAASRRG